MIQYWTAYDWFTAIATYLALGVPWAAHCHKKYWFSKLEWAIMIVCWLPFLLYWLFIVRKRNA